MPQHSSPAATAAPSQPEVLLPHRSSFPSSHLPCCLLPLSPLLLLLPSSSLHYAGRLRHPAQATSVEADWDDCGDRFLASSTSPTLSSSLLSSPWLNPSKATRTP
ncbi:hypothetical protein PR202_ga20651 [Eleusine coracana subsp. coracana]|uniref:Uncharacterized protein n=1 Tax=Eleusine coracana subsp. coracana TaxID=191504 RepID=A0AAV5CYB7_ELECO|nr:hypothetical protein PR202_ga20651 [Eleusine coracana subsp. coracana]